MFTVYIGSRVYLYSMYSIFDLHKSFIFCCFLMICIYIYMKKTQSNNANKNEEEKPPNYNNI